MSKRAVIIGGGIAGLATAYFLNKKGIDVSVLERKIGAGLGASFANGSQISFSHISPKCFYTKPKFFGLLKPKNILSTKINLKEVGVKRFLTEQEKEKPHNDKNRTNIAKIADISKYALDELIKDEKLDRFFKSCGILHLFDTKESLEKELIVAKHVGQNFNYIHKNDLAECEPGINNFDKKFAGGIFYPDDKTSNCHDICKILENILTEKGVKFYYKTQIEDLVVENGIITAAVTNTGKLFKSDYFICANGTEASKLTSKLGLEYQIFPVEGYSYTFNMEGCNYAPFIGLIDRSNQMVYSLYKNYLRIAGFFDLGVEMQGEIKQRMLDFENTIFSIFPLLRRNKIVHKWTENRPFTPSSIPIVGKASGYENLLINGGGGSLGFTLAFGNGKILTELI